MAVVALDGRLEESSRRLSKPQLDPVWTLMRSLIDAIRPGAADR